MKFDKGSIKNLSKLSLIVGTGIRFLQVKVSNLTNDPFCDNLSKDYLKNICFFMNLDTSVCWKLTERSNTSGQICYFLLRYLPLFPLSLHLQTGMLFPFFRFIHWNHDQFVRNIPNHCDINRDEISYSLKKNTSSWPMADGLGSQY